jgi:hypothetical protein
MNMQYSLLTQFVSLIVLVVVSLLMALDICIWKGVVIQFCRNVVKLQNAKVWSLEQLYEMGWIFLIYLTL